MIYLLLTILVNVFIFLNFRAYSRFGVDTLQAIVVNYIACVITGLLFLSGQDPLQTFLNGGTWTWIGGILGLVFIGTFYLMARTTQKVGVSVASVASKMSLTIPVVFSLFFMQIEKKEMDVLNYTGIILALAAIFLTSIKRERGAPREAFNYRNMIMPVSVFLLSGLIDTTINYTNLHFLDGPGEAVFPIVIFVVAGVVGMVGVFFTRRPIQLRSIVGGITLGVPNYFSIYFLIKALSAFDNNGAILYPMLNIGIIIISSLLAVVLFDERLKPLNKLGIALAVLAIILLSHQEILAAL
ncbi:hypothetical protein AB9P05_11925 [Roseivirga sp. BDSF3-8]|uniref:hypothetical protein n=1 Tax=Roseivirga sp. BDSF3-8 TaxID=3241598 RepID=UPI003531E36F